MDLTTVGRIGTDMGTNIHGSQGDLLWWLGHSTLCFNGVTGRSEFQCDEYFGWWPNTCKSTCRWDHQVEDWLFLHYSVIRSFARLQPWHWTVLWGHCYVIAMLRHVVHALWSRSAAGFPFFFRLQRRTKEMYRAWRKQEHGHKQFRFQILKGKCFKGTQLLKGPCRVLW